MYAAWRRQATSAAALGSPHEYGCGRKARFAPILPPRRIGPFSSEVLVLGALDEDKGVILLQPDQDVALGDRIG